MQRLGSAGVSGMESLINPKAMPQLGSCEPAAGEAPVIRSRLLPTESDGRTSTIESINIKCGSKPSSAIHVAEWYLCLFCTVQPY